MRKAFLKKIKAMLESQEAEIIEKSKRNSTIDIDADGDETDQIQAKIIALANIQLLVRDKGNLVKIQNALQKIENGTFGSCEECGEEIAEKRLLVNPGFVTCVACAEQIEMINKRNNR